MFRRMIGSFIQGEKFDMLEGFGLVIESFIRIQKNLHPFSMGVNFYMLEGFERIIGSFIQSEIF